MRGEVWISDPPRADKVVNDYINNVTSYVVKSKLSTNRIKLESHL